MEDNGNMRVTLLEGVTKIAGMPFCDQAPGGLLFFCKT